LELVAGARLRSMVCQTEVVVVKPPSGDIDLRCGGVVVAKIDADVLQAGGLVEGFSGGSLVGKRYECVQSGLELLCTKAGEGLLSVGEVLLTTQQAKPLPASD
jgi:hypothetical protein